MILDEQGIYLRPLEVSDISQKYVDWLNDPDVNRYLETRHEEQTIDSCTEFVRSCIHNPNEYLFGVFDKESDCHIGNAKIGSINNLYKRGQISLFIGEKSYWHKGYGSKIIAALTKYGFIELGLQKIEAGCYETNLPSLRAFLKNRFTVEGFFREHIEIKERRFGCFWLAILRREYES